MRLQEMTAVVRDELEHIPNGPEPQNMLRMVYAALRKNSLGKKVPVAMSRDDVLQESIAIVKKTNAQWTELFDHHFFRA